MQSFQKGMTYLCPFGTENGKKWNLLLTRKTFFWQVHLLSTNESWKSAVINMRTCLLCRLAKKYFLVTEFNGATQNYLPHFVQRIKTPGIVLPSPKFLVLEVPYCRYIVKRLQAIIVIIQTWPNLTYVYPIRVSSRK